MEAAWRGAHMPDEQLLDTSTPTKDFSWTMGNADDYANFATAGKTSVVQAYVTGENADDPVIPVGKVKINWSRPKKCIWEVTIFPVTWRVPQGDGFVDLICKVFSSNEALTEHLQLWGGEKIGQIALAVVGAGGEAGAVEPTIIRVTTAEGVSGETVANQFLKVAAESAPETAAVDEAISQEAQGTVRVRVKQTGDPVEGEPAEPAIEREAPTEFKNNCFVAGTPVLMGDGSLKPIEQIQAGDEVESKDPATGRIQIKKVVRTFRNLAPVILSLTLGSGERLTTTPGHPFATTQHGDFVLAGRLPLQAQLPQFDGHSTTLASESTLAQTTPIFNFEVQDFHTYFVGKSHLWVHNQSLPYLDLFKDLKPGYDDAITEAVHWLEISADGADVTAPWVKEGGHWGNLDDAYRNLAQSKQVPGTDARIFDLRSDAFPTAESPRGSGRLIRSVNANGEFEYFFTPDHYENIYRINVDDFFYQP